MGGGHGGDSAPWAIAAAAAAAEAPCRLRGEMSTGPGELIGYLLVASAWMSCDAFTAMAAAASVLTDVPLRDGADGDGVLTVEADDVERCGGPASAPAMAAAAWPPSCPWSARCVIGAS
mmetsp:Transcript_102469/g.264974  ORF Transcript_102469/g.264974 Transcript_102469/m.264974 type:complete len:119 (-) Transcript_102469:793-1149(-)